MSKRFWIAVASAEHVRLGRAQGFMQVCHGKAAPLRRLSPGDGIIYYSPSEIFRGKDKLQAFTAIGTLKDRPPYQADMGGGFCPFRRDVYWAEAQQTNIRPLLPHLTFAGVSQRWGYQLRFGLFEIKSTDFQLIAKAMDANFDLVV